MVIKIRYRYILYALVLITIFMFYKIPIQAQPTHSPNTETIYLPILMYHGVHPTNTSKDVITPYEMESDLQFLRDNEYNPITMTQLIDWVYENKPLPSKPIMITFDDGYLNAYKYAFPLLKQYNMPAVFSIIGKSIDEFSEKPDDNLIYSYATWDHLNEMLDSGLVEVQNHSYDLHTKAKGRIGATQKAGESLQDYEEALRKDLLKLQDRITEQTGKISSTFTYPYGRYSEHTAAISKKLGFRATLSCDYGVNAITKDPEKLYNLKRISRAHGAKLSPLLKDAFQTLQTKQKF